jgi:hypothetical protein
MDMVFFLIVGGTNIWPASPRGQAPPLAEVSITRPEPELGTQIDQAAADPKNRASKAKTPPSAATSQ